MCLSSKRRALGGEMPRMDRKGISRAEFLKGAALGIVGAALPMEVLAQGTTEPEVPGAQKAGTITDAMIAESEPLVGVAYPPESRKGVASGVKQQRKSLDALRSRALENATAPAYIFRPEGRQSKEGRKIEVRTARVGNLLPSVEEDLAFLSVVELGALLRARRISSIELTKFFLKRLETYETKLNAVVTLTPERALRTATEADRLFAQKLVRSPLQGIPTGVKDLFATLDAPTTWGAAPYKDQRLTYDAAVVERLEAAHAPILAKLSLGALAYGDIWFGGMTRNPWNPKQGSSGSSAGSAAAVAAGLLPFAIGTETLGSVVSPAQRCRIVGLRPTFGRTSRFGAMALSWSMDKVGVLARSPEDTAVVLGAIAGADPRDPTSVDRPFSYRATDSLKGLKVAVVGTEALDEDDIKGPLSAAAMLLRQLGATLSTGTFTNVPDGVSEVLTVEAAAAFDDLTRSGRVDEMKGSLWPPAFRAAMYVTGVDYIQAMRQRTIAMATFEREFGDADLILAADRAGQLLVTTNLTGHPQIYIPLGLDPQGRSFGVSLIGRLYEEGRMLQAAQALQTKFAAPKTRPDLTLLDALG